MTPVPVMCHGRYINSFNVCNVIKQYFASVLILNHVPFHFFTLSLDVYLFIFLVSVSLPEADIYYLCFGFLFHCGLLHFFYFKSVHGPRGRRFFHLLGVVRVCICTA